MIYLKVNFSKELPFFVFGSNKSLPEFSYSLIIQPEYAYRWRRFWKSINLRWFLALKSLNQN